MQDLKQVLENRKFEVNKGKVNSHYERAFEFLDYIGVKPDRGNVIFVLKLCKMYGQNRVYALRSWFKDMRYDVSRWKGLIVWRLQSDTKNVAKNTT